MRSGFPPVFRFGNVSIIWRPRSIIVCFGLLLAAAIVAMLLLGTGSLKFSPKEVLETLLGATQNPAAERIVLGVRLPRVLTAALVGACLGAAGSIFQSISRNPLGSPDILGFTTGAATGAIVQIILFDAGALETAAAAVVAGLAAAGLVYSLAMKGQSSGGYRLVLVGIGVGAVLSGLNTVLLVKGDLDQAMSAQLWLGGSLNTRSWSHVVPAAIGLFAVIPFVLTYASRLDVIEMGDDTAGQLGVNVERTRFLMVMMGVGLTAIATAAAGPIAFIALIAPQLARRLTHAPQVPLLSSALMGATLLLCADLLAQRLPLNLNLPIGLMTGMIGGVYLLWILSRRRN
ncbi:FecCD family ABC transporter permease [Agrobacterium sp. NPDC090273]|uniref:FecCD family ABC transporter permease n=1 Tax=Agrobacterium sp. NPDC090273 TaxID=3363919 RepID=UPI00383BAFBE